MRDGKAIVTLKRAERTNITVASATLDNNESQQTLRLKIEGDGRYYSFYYATSNGEWKLLASDYPTLSSDTCAQVKTGQMQDREPSLKPSKRGSLVELGPKVGRNDGTLEMSYETMFLFLSVSV